MIILKTTGNQESLNFAECSCGDDDIENLITNSSSECGIPCQPTECAQNHYHVYSSGRLVTDKSYEVHRGRTP